MVGFVFLVFTGFDRVGLGVTGFYWVSLGFTRFYWVLLGFTGLYRVSVIGARRWHKRNVPSDDKRRGRLPKRVGR